MNYQINHMGKVCIVAIQGSIDALTSDETLAQFKTCLDQSDHFLVADLTQVDFMSSAGLRLIMQVLKDARQQGGDLRLAGAQPGVGKMLKMSGFTTILKTFDTVDAASASYG